MVGLIEKAVERVLLGDDCLGPGDFGSTHKIVVCQRGFVYAGDVRRAGEYLVLENAVNIRCWGTSRGLGELAEHGNRENTKADPAGTVRVHQLAVVSMMDCKETIRASA